MHYTLQIATFTLALFTTAWILGRGALVLLGVGEHDQERTAAGLLAIPTGIGMLAVTLFLLATQDLLNATGIGIAVAIEALVFGWVTLRAQQRRGESPGRSMAAFVQRNALLLFCTAVIAIPIFLRALGAPLEWDEISYHLPYVREYIDHGGLTVAGHLRFPLHSHNYQLLYAAALIFSSEVAAHMVHAFSGALVALGTFFLGREFFGRLTGLIAAIMYLSVAGSMMDNAYVDLGLSLFVFYAFFAFAQWQKSGNDGFLWLSAFLLAMAAGTKYQALSLLPLFGLMLLSQTRSPRRLLGYALLIALFGSWWYLRNYMISGDPIHPLGGRIFGFWVWNEYDLDGVRDHLSRINDSLPIYVYPALLAPFLLRRNGEVYKTLAFLALGSLAFWLATTRYLRYLIPIFPFLALLSLHALGTVAQRLAPAGWRWPAAPATGPSLQLALRIVPAFLLLAIVFAASRNELKDACFSDACIDRTLTEQTATWRLRKEVPGFEELKLYQYGFENEIYYLGRPLGDWRGMYRYQSIWLFNQDASLLMVHLLYLGRDSILVHKTRYPFYLVLEDPELGEYFETLYENEQLVLLKVRE